MLKSIMARHKKVLGDSEKGFTLIEVMISVVIIGILAAIAIPVFGSQQRGAVEATIKHDTQVNRSVMLANTDEKLYVSINDFVSKAAQTDRNIASYTVNESQTEACTQTVREIKEDDIVVWRFLSSVGKLEPLYCPELGEVAEVTPPTEIPEETVPEDSTPEEEAEEVSNYNGETSGNPFYPGNAETIINTEILGNTLNQVHYKLTITSTSSTPAPWIVNVNKQTIPMKNNYIAGISDSRFFRANMSDDLLRITGTGQLEKTSQSSSVTMELWIEAQGTLPVINDKISAISTPKGSATGGAWYGTQSFTVKNSSQFFGGWSTEIDLTQLKTLVSSRANQAPVVNHSDLTITHVQGNIYKVESNHRGTAIYSGNEFTFTVQIG